MPKRRSKVSKPTAKELLGDMDSMQDEQVLGPIGPNCRYRGWWERGGKRYALTFVWVDGWTPVSEVEEIEASWASPKS